MVEPDPDQEIVELLDIIKSVHKERFSSVESLRERVGTEFTLEDYKDALRLDEAVRARLIEV